MDCANYSISNATDRWFKDLADFIINYGNSLINLHRAHRLDAIRREKQNFPEIDMLFVGHMGGELLKRIFYDDYITSKFFRLYQHNQNDVKSVIASLLQERYIKHEFLDLDYISNFLQQQSFIYLEEKRKREFAYQMHVAASMHHSQDMSIYGMYVPYVVNPFMDIDFLELIFSSNYNLLHNTEKSVLEKLIEGPAFHVNITHLLDPELDNVPFAKRGYYSANEYLGNKFLYVLKRLYRQKKQHPANFPYDDWMVHYVRNEFKLLVPEISDLFDMDGLVKNFEENTQKSTEAYWHKYTNPINVSKNINRFCTEK